MKIALGLGFILVGLHAFGRDPVQEQAHLDRPTSARLKALGTELAEAQKRGDETAVSSVVARTLVVLGDQAGLPEVADEPRRVPSEGRRLTDDELARSFVPYLDYMERRRWWKIGLDPTETNHAARELATLIEGCVGASHADKSIRDRALTLARDAADYLIWSQEQGGAKLYPFPARRKGQGRPFEVAERIFAKAESEGKLNLIVRNGWAIDDDGSGGLQFDNGLAGVALLHLFEITGDAKYRKSALNAADWAMKSPPVPNWNYNSFSMELLAEAYRITKDRNYLDAARSKFKLGVLPGQLTKGPRAGRWADPHNARPAYHFIMIRGLARLAMVLPRDDPDHARVLEALRLGLAVMMPVFKEGIPVLDSAFEAILVVKQLSPEQQGRLDTEVVNTLFGRLEAYCGVGVLAQAPKAGPGAWGQYLAYRAQIKR